MTTYIPLATHKRLPKRLPHSLGFSRYGLEFDGTTNQYVKVLHSATLNQTDTISVGCFVLFSSVAGQIFIINKRRDVNTLTWVLGLTAHGGLFKPFFSVRTDLGEVLARYDIQPSANLFYFYVGTYDGSDVKMHINAVEVASTPHGGNLLQNTDPEDGRVILGVDARDLADYNVNGIITDVFIYEAALTEKQQQEIMLDYPRLNTTNLRLWLRMEEGSGTTIDDQSDNGNDGSLLPAGSEPDWVRLRKWRLRSDVGL